MDEDFSGADADGDGFARPQGCDDGDPRINPGAREAFGNAVDENCNSRADPYPLLNAEVTSRFLPGSRSTRVIALVARFLRAGSSVELRCSGRRCPFRKQGRSSTTPARRSTGPGHAGVAARTARLTAPPGGASSPIAS